LSLDERIGQLFMIRAHSNLGPDHVAEVERQIRQYHVGGLCFFQGTTSKQIELLNTYQKLSAKIPMMVAMDAEWGLGMRFKEGVIDYPRALMLGAVQDNSLIYEYGKEIARQLKRVGVQLNFAPVVDINNNPENPVINYRSFGEDKYNVTTKSYMYMRGMQDLGVAACAKHFPGHGDTDVDSHHELPVIKHSLERLEDVELFPFETLISQGIESVMVAHLNIPALDDRPGIPTTLSDRVVNDLLRKKLGFNGLVFTDALEMEAVAKHFENGIVEIKALEAGNDILLLPNDLDKAFNVIKQQISEGKIHEERINESVRRVLRAKYRMGLDHYQPIREIGVFSDLNNGHALSLKHELIENALTLVRDNDALFPLIQKDKNIASLAIGTNTLSHFQVMLSEYEEIPRYLAKSQITETDKASLLGKLEKYEYILVSLHGMSQHSRNNFGLDESVLSFLNDLNQKKKVLLCIFGNPYSLKYFDDFDEVVVCYDDDRLTQNLAAQAIYGAISFRGRLPVTVTARSAYGMGINTKANFRIGYSVPERVGMSSDSLREVDRLVYELIEKKAAPGAQLLIAKDGKVVYQKEYGFHTYQKSRPVQHNDVYDLASVTKVTASTMAVMKLFEDGKLDLKTPIVKYLPELEGSNKEAMTLEEIMTHQAGLLPWIPFYKATMASESHRPSPNYYSEKNSDEYSVKVMDDMFLRSDYPDTIWQMIIDSDLRPNKSYRYSDLGFYIIGRIVERVSGKALDRYVEEQFYLPLNMSRTIFNPLHKIRKEEIVPTEKDDYFRFTSLQGYVHDMGAAMMNGVSGHAGLFSNCGDLVKIYQMLLNHGYYGGKQFLQEKTIKLFTRRHLGSSRRGYGFDMKQLEPNSHINVCPFTSNSAFGHSGFTGTCVWVDPEYKLIYIFLSNRTYPTMTNNLLQQEDYRTKIQEAVYRAFLPSFVQDQS
ncbi:MAG: serine hydrolase, partial [Saprospiraceae bacterium]|nr:serine hydrolase [Saprospiraceae bacterium]